MTLQEAKALRDEIREHYHCIVPLGFGPGGYVARIFGLEGAIDFHTRFQYRAWHVRRLRERRAQLREWAMPQKRRSPIEIMIDRACGREQP
jgi:hypothetical protein